VLFKMWEMPVSVVLGNERSKDRLPEISTGLGRRPMSPVIHSRAGDQQGSEAVLRRSGGSDWPVRSVGGGITMAHA
jgi:hypothetical protein